MPPSSPKPLPPRGGRTPRSLAVFCRTTLPLLHRAMNGRRAFDLAARIVASDRWNSFDRFHDTTRTLTEALDAGGVAAEVHRLPTGGPAGNGRWIIHEAADVRSATLEIIAPFRRRLLDYRRNPWCVIQWSNGTAPAGSIGALAIVDRAEDVAALRPGALSGKIVLTRLPLRDTARPFYEKGALALLSDAGVKGLPDATPWLKYGWGSLPADAAYARPVGFSLSAREGERLRRWAERRGPLTLRVRADIRRHAGAHDVVDARVAGAGDPQDEVWSFAHSAEPGALDNASGVAVTAEIARTLEGLIRAGRLPRPRRTIRLLAGYECYGLFPMLERERRLQPPLAGVCVDSVGARADRCPGGYLSWYETVPASAGFVNDVGERILRAQLRRESAGYRYARRGFVPTLDTLIGDPRFGFPCPWISNHGGPYYHSSADAPAVLSPRGLAVAAAATAAYLYFLANLGTREAAEIAEWQSDLAAADLGALRRSDGPDRVEYLLARHRETLSRLRRWWWGGDRAELEARWRACAARVDAAARDARARIGRPRRRPSAPPAERRVLLRTAPLIYSDDNLTAEYRDTFKASGLPRWAHYWADGRRTLGEIRALVEVERGRSFDPAAAAAHFQALERLGYVRSTAPGDLVGRARLTRDLRALGVRPGMNLMVHAALSKIGVVEGGAETVLDALREAVGPRGTLLFPSFNHGRARVFNPLTTPTANGAIPEAVWRRPDAVRSFHPTHALAAIGPRARVWLDGHLEAGAFGADSPIARMMRDDGFVLCLGVDLRVASVYHVAEVSVPCRCLDLFGRRVPAVLPDGTVGPVPGMAWRARPCPAPVLPDLARRLSRRGCLRRGRIGAAESLLARARDIWEARRAQLREICPTCRIRPRRGPPREE